MSLKEVCVVLGLPYHRVRYAEATHKIVIHRPYKGKWCPYGPAEVKAIADYFGVPVPPLHARQAASSDTTNHIANNSDI